MMFAGEPIRFVVTSDGKNYVTFESKATLETVIGRTTKISGTIDLDTENLESDPLVIIEVDLGSFDTGIEMRNTHMRSEKYLYVEKYPKAVFKGTKLKTAQTKLSDGETTTATVTGIMSLHGVEKEMDLTGEITYIKESEATKQARGAGDWIHITAEFKLKLTDFNIEIPQFLFLKMSNDIRIYVDMFASGSHRPTH